MPTEPSPTATPTAVRAAAEAAEAAKALEDRKKTETRPARAQVGAATPAAADPPPPATLHDDGARLYAAFRSPDVGLAEFPASLLAAHCLATIDEATHMGSTQAIQWAKAFASAHPIVWSALRVGHMPNFMASMRRANVATKSAEALCDAAAIIRG